MKPVDQEFISIPEIGQYGDCQRAVIASLLELPISKVPHFLQEADGDAGTFWNSVANFCEKHGYEFMHVTREKALEIGGYHGMTGPSPRGMGMYHAVVALNGEVVHDPHPSRAGLLGEPRQWFYSVLVKETSK